MGIAPPPSIPHGGALPLGSAVIQVSMKRRPFNHWARRRQLASDSQRLPADRQLVVAGGLWFVVCGLWFVVCGLWAFSWNWPNPGGLTGCAAP